LITALIVLLYPFYMTQLYYIFDPHRLGPGGETMYVEHTYMTLLPGFLIFQFIVNSIYFDKNRKNAK
jgi:hypothetical protein